MSDSTTVAEILLRVNATGLENFAAAEAQLKSLDAAAMTATDSWVAGGANMAQAADLDAISLAGIGTAASVATPKIEATAASVAALTTEQKLAALGSYALGNAVAVTGDKSAIAAIKTNDLRLAYAGAGAVSERNVAGLLALTGGAVSAEIAVTALIGGLTIFAAKTASDVNTAFQQIQGNTAVSDQEIQYMREHTLQLASDSSKSWNDIAGGFLHAANEGYHFAAATQVVEAGLKGAEATGGSVTDTVNTLVTVMHDFGASADQASHVMAILLEAAARGNTVLPELVHSFTLVASTGGAMHQSLSEVAAIYSTLTEATGNASRSQSQEVLMLQRIIAPTKQAQTLLAELSKTTGIDLVKANRDAADGQLSLSNYMELVRTATAGNNKELLALFGGAKSGLGALELLGKGWDSYRQNLDKTNVSQADANKKLNELASKAEGQYSEQLHHLGNQVVGLANDLGQILLPALGQAAHGLSDWITLVENTAGAVGHLRDNLDSWQSDQTGKMSKLAADISGPTEQLGFMATRYGLVKTATDTAKSSTDSMTTALGTLKERTGAAASEHAREASASESLIQKYALQKTSIDHLSASYDRLIAASKAYTAAASSQGSAGIGAATSQLQSAIAPLAPDFRAALQPVLDGFISSLSTEQESYLRKVSDGDATYQQKLTALHDAFLQKSAGLDGQKLAKEQQTYDQAVNNLRAEHQRHNADLQATFLAHVQGIEKAMKAQAEPGALFATLESKVNKLATVDLNALSYAITTHAANIAQATTLAIRAGQDKQRVDATVLDASTRVALGLGDLSTALANEQKALTQATDRAATDIFKGDSAGKIDKAVAAAAKLEASHSHMSAAEEQAALRIEKASGDYSAYLSGLQQQLQNRLSTAEGKYISDKASGAPAGTLASDRQAVDEARSKLQHLTATISELEGKSTKAVDQFAAELTKAQNRAKESLDALALAIDNGDSPGKIHRLALEAEAAGQRLAKLGLASDRAAITGGSPSEQIAARADIAKRALDALAMGIADHDTPGKLRLLGDEAQKAAAAEAKTTEAQLRAAERVGTPSQRLSAREQDEQGKLANAEAKITLAIEDHERVTKADIAAAQEHERAVQRDTQAQWDAAFAAASVSGRHAMLAQQASGLISRFQTLQSATQSVIDAQMAYSADQTNILKIRLENLSKAYEDATAILQARNVAIKDQGTAGVTAVTDTSGILKAQSDILQAILQVGLSSKAESAATMQQAIQVANDQLAVARDQQSIDQAAAAAQQKIDADNVKIAEDRAALDRIQGGAAMAVGFQQLQLDHDKITLAKDQLKLTALTNQGISLIASHFGETKSYDDKIRAVLTKIEGDNAQINADLKGAQSENAQWQTLMYNATKQVDQDTRQLATDQASSDAGSASGQKRIAVDQQLVQADQTYLQDLQAVDQATQSVTDAFNQLASDQSKMVVDSLNAMVTAVNDATGVLQAISGVSKASADGQIKAVQDQSAIIKAEGDIASAKSSQQLAVARDELTIAEDTLTMDQTNARWAIRLATDQVKMAEDKAAADAVKAAWDHTIDLDIIKVDQDKVKLAEDQLLLTEENLSLQAQVVDLLGGDSSGAMGQMPDILKQISGDQSAIATDQAAQQRDQQLAAQQEAAMALQTAYDQQQMARDQAAADAASAAGQMRLAQDGNRLAADQVAEQMQTNSILSMSRADMQQWNAGFLDAIRNLRSGVDYHWVGSGPNPFETFINGAPASFSMNPSP